MMPNTEPNSIPSTFADRAEWRETYAAYVDEFKKSRQAGADRAALYARLAKLGFAGAALDAEMKYIREG